jgi:hypothetical protein
VPGLIPLLQAPGNRHLFEAPESPADLVSAVALLLSQAFAVGMLSLRAGVPDGVVANALTSQRHLVTYLIPLFQDPDEADLALGIYLHNLFWSQPLRRAYCQLPIVEETGPHRRLLERSAFVLEGALPGHALIDGSRVDVAAYGLLRSDFDSWCLERAPELSLS